MPDLPALTLSQAHFDRVVAAFPGNTLAEKASSYKAWLTGQLIDYVRMIETVRLEEAARIATKIKIDEVMATLPPRPVFSPFPQPTEPAP
jgi:hypothetical protein